jgi:hypothetical protein
MKEIIVTQTDSQLLEEDVLIEKYPYVMAWIFPIVKEYEELFNNTGGNDPLDLLNDFLNPGTDERPNRLMTVNVVRWTLAMAVYSQVILLRKLQDEAELSRVALEWLIKGPSVDADVAYYLCERNGDGYTGIVSYDEDGDPSVDEVDYSYQPDLQVEPTDVIAIIRQEIAELGQRVAEKEARDEQPA